MNKKKLQNLVLNLLFFAAIMALTFWCVFRGQNIEQTLLTIRQMSVPWIVAAVALALLFVAGEGCLIWNLMRGIGEKTTLSRCISWSFVGFFFSGITPSATGGQPVQLYRMKKYGCSLSASSVVLMTVAIVYKFVLVLVALLLLLFWGGPLRERLLGYYGLFFLGLFLNAALVIILLLVMLSPRLIRGCFDKIERLFIRIGIWKEKPERTEKIEGFLMGYQNTVGFLRTHRGLLAATVAGTFLQRFCLFVLTFAVYRGLGLSGVSMTDIVLLQASVYIAVDMLPVPGAQGITEAMYAKVFSAVFPGQTLVASMCITRGVSFYLMLLLGLLPVIFGRKKRGGSG